MQFKPQAHIKTKQLFLGSIKLQAGNNVLPANKLAKLKAHPNYQYYVDLGILIPNEEEVKPTGKERTVAKKSRAKKKSTVELAETVETDLPLDGVSDDETTK